MSDASRPLPWHRLRLRTLVLVHYWYHSNLEDPNDRGYDAIRRAFLLRMVEALAPR